MSKADYTIRVYDGTDAGKPVAVEGERVAQWLAVRRECTWPKSYAVDHIPTGFGVCNGFDTKAAAVAFARSLAHPAWETTRATKDRLDTKLPKRIVAAVGRRRRKLRTVCL